MDNPVTYEQAEAIYDAAMEASQDVPDGDPEASKAEAVAQIKYRVGELVKSLLTAKPRTLKDDAIGQAIDALRVNALRHGNKELEEIADKAHEELIALRVGRTAEPEPCEDVDRVIEQLEKITGIDRTEESGPFACIDRAKGRAIVAAYASQVADKRAEELREALKPFAEIGAVIPQNWNGKYPLKNQQVTGVGFRLATVDEYRNATKALAATEPKP